VGAAAQLLRPRGALRELRPVPREAYEPALQAGAQLWWYVSCASHGCNKEGTRHPAFSGWPGYSIDADAAAARALGALAFANRIAGQLHYDVVFAYHETDPWTDQWHFGGNGDGTLYYPGTPARIGGQSEVPVETLRLVQVSRGIFDHAALTLCAQLGDAAFARREAQRMAPGLRRFSREAGAYAAMRARLYERIDALLAQRKAHATAP
jgi:hypothetical protein